MCHFAVFPTFIMLLLPGSFFLRGGGGFMWKASWSLVLPMYPCAVKWCLTRRNLLRTTEKKKEKEKPPSGVGKTKPSVSAEDARRLIQPAPVPPNPGRKRKKKNTTPHSNQQSERYGTLFSPALLAVLALYSSAGGNKKLIFCSEVELNSASWSPMNSAKLPAFGSEGFDGRSGGKNPKVAQSGITSRRCLRLIWTFDSGV